MWLTGKNQDKLKLDTVISVQNELDAILAVMVEEQTAKDILVLFSEFELPGTFVLPVMLYVGCMFSSCLKKNSIKKI